MALHIPGPHVASTATLVLAAALLPGTAFGNWLHVGRGHCSGCNGSVYSPNVTGYISAHDCENWVDRKCPVGGDLTCPDATAVEFRAGWWTGDWHQCRAWTCSSMPSWDTDLLWDCFYRVPPSSTTATATTTTLTTTTATTRLTSTTTGSHCSERPGIDYVENWAAQGESFFDEFDFLLHDSNHGAAQYLDREEAEASKVVEAFPTHAILRVGSRGLLHKRQSAKIRTKREWKYFLAVFRFTHVPQGCGLWPALWTHAHGVAWPNGGELDVLEYVNDLPAFTSFHTGEENRCKLSGADVNLPGCPAFPDLNGEGYDCVTDYPDHLGCAPNRVPLRNPVDLSRNPGIVAIEWTADFVKIFNIPEGEAPADIGEGKQPKPDTWDNWLSAYYPFAASNRRLNGTCPNASHVMSPQQIILNINLCGDWAGKVWPMSGSCVNRVGPRYPQECKAVDPLEEEDPVHDCCTQFVWDENSTYGADEYMQERGFFNISWIKVYRQRSR